MTATTTTELPDFDGEPVASSAITIAGVGATMGSTLAMESDTLIRKHDRVYVIIEAVCPKISFPDDKDGNQMRVAHLHPEAAFWADPEYAKQFVTEQAQRREKVKEQLDGQTSIDDELAAADREARDGTDSPEDIAADSAARVKDGN